MSNFKIDVEINAPAIAEAISLLASAVAYKKEYKGQNESLKKEAPKVEVPKNTPEVKEQPKTEKTESSLTIEEVRALVTAKAKINRAKVKALLTEYGTNSVTHLAKEHYEEFYKKVGDV